MPGEAGDAAERREAQLRDSAFIRRAPERVVAAAMMQPSGSRPEIPDLFYQNSIKGWGPVLCEDSQAHIDEIVEHARRLLKAHEPVTAGRPGRS